MLLNKISVFIRQVNNGTSVTLALAGGDTWIQSSNRLDDILGNNLAQDLRETGNYKRILAKVQPDGTIVFKELDNNATIIDNFTP